jgi:hypothetical protein
MWKFLHFVATVRNPLFMLFEPLVKHKAREIFIVFIQ